MTNAIHSSRKSTGIYLLTSGYTLRMRTNGAASCQLPAETGGPRRTRSSQLADLRIRTLADWPRRVPAHPTTTSSFARCALRCTHFTEAKVRNRKFIKDGPARYTSTAKERLHGRHHKRRIRRKFRFLHAVLGPVGHQKG